MRPARPRTRAGAGNFAALPRARVPGWVVYVCACYLVVRLAFSAYAWATRQTTVERLHEAAYQVVRIDAPHQWLVARTVDGRREQACVRLLAVRLPSSPPHDAGTRHRQLVDEARREVERRWLGRTVMIELGRRQIDADGMFLVTVRDGSGTAQEQLVRAGWLIPDVRPDDAAALVRKLEQAVGEARAAGRGCWAGQLVAPPGL